MPTITGRAKLPGGTTALTGTWYVRIRTNVNAATDPDGTVRGGIEDAYDGGDGATMVLPAGGYEARFESSNLNPDTGQRDQYGWYPFDVAAANLTWGQIMTTPVETPVTPADVTLAEEARDEAVAARDEAVAANTAAQQVGTTNDTVIAGRVAEPTSATRAAADAVYSPKSFTIGSQSRTVQQRARKRPSVREWLTDDSGNADQTTQLQAALTSTSGYGDELYIDPEVAIRLDSTVEMTADAPVRISGGGKLIVPTGLEALRIAPPTSAKTAVSAVTYTTDPFGYGSSLTRVTVASTAAFQRGDIAFINAENTYYDGTKQGELATVAEVDATNNYVWLAGRLAGTYTTSPFLRRLSRQPVVIDGLRASYRTDPWDYAGGSPGRGAIIVEGAVDPVVRVQMRDLPGIGLRMVSCWQPDVDLGVSRLRNDNAAQYLGYGVTVTAATRGGLYRVRGRLARHLFTTNVYSRPGFDLWDYGAPREGTTTGQAHAATGIAWDTHANTYDWTFDTCSTFAETLEPGSGAGTWYGLQDRGCNTRILNYHHIGTNNPLYLIGQSVEYPEENVTLVRGAVLRNLDPSALVVAYNTVTASASGSTRKVVRFEGGSWDYLRLLLPTGHALLEVDGVRIHRASQLRLGTNGQAVMRNVHRSSNGGDEAVQLPTGSTLLMDNWLQEGVLSAGNGNAVAYKSGASGTATLKYGRIVATDATTQRAAVAAGSTLTQTALTNLGV